MFTTMQEVIEANKGNGNYFFSEDTMAFFGSAIVSELITVPDGQFFVTEEDNFDRTRRLFTVRRVSSDGSVNTEGKFLGFKTKQDAMDYILDVQEEEED